MLNKKTLNAYFLSAQNTRVLIRQATCQNGFCLIIDNDWETSSYLRKALSYRNMESKCVDTIEDALIGLRKDGPSIICILVNIDFVNQKVIDGLETIKIPYVAYTNNKSTTSIFKKQYPHMNIMLDTSKTALIDSLGVV